MFSGGGTGGSVTPLLAVAERMVRDAADFVEEKIVLEFVFVGTPDGPEKEMVAAFSAETGLTLRFISLPAGKLRRYFSVHNFLDLFKVVRAFFRSLTILAQEKPAIVISAGSFVSVPLVWAAAFRKIPILIHQQDVRPGLANKLMAPYARAITVVFEKSLYDYGVKAVWIGNPTREGDSLETKDARAAVRAKYDLSPALPLVVATGGRMGAAPLNRLLSDSRPFLSACDIIHLAGPNKSAAAEKGAASGGAYRTLESLPHREFLELVAAADVVITRAGLGSITELSVLRKPAIVIPIPDSHQEDNAAILKTSEAAIVLNQKELTPEKFAGAINQLLAGESVRGRLAVNIGRIIKREAADSLAGIIWEIIR